MAHKVYIKDNQKEVKIPSGMRILIRRSCNAVLETEDFPQWAEVNITFVDNKEIQKLNKKHLNKNAPTDVLSFPLGENGKYDKNPETDHFMLGDIVLSMEKAVEQAKLYSHSLQREVAFLVVHGMFHLLGYDHEEGGLAAVQMREKEETVLEKLGLPRTISYTNPDNLG